MAEKQAIEKNSNGVYEQVSKTDLDGLASVRTAKVRVKNTTASPILAGTPVREINGSGDGTFFFIEAAPIGSREFLGITNELIAVNDEGEVVVMGYSRYNTSAFTPGDKIYIDFDGSIVTQEPLQDHIYLGIAKDSLVLGTIYLPPDRGFKETRNYKKSTIPDSETLTIPDDHQASYCGFVNIGVDSEIRIEDNAELCII